MSWAANNIGKVVYSVLGTLVFNRVYPVVAPQNPTYPFMVYNVVSVTPNATKATTSVSDKIRVQVDMYDKDIDALNTLASSVRDALDLLTGTYSSIIVSTCRFDGQEAPYQNEVRVYCISQDYIFRINIK